MKTAKPAVPVAATAAEPSSSRRSQPVRQTRVHGSRAGAAGRALAHRDNAANAALGREQPIDIFPGIVHFADAITALPKELVRHFTLLREVDAKVHAPQHTLFRLVDNALNIPVSDPSRPDTPAASGSAAPESAPMSAQTSTNGVVAPPDNPTALALAAPSVEGSPYGAAHDPNVLARRRAYREAANKVSEMLVSLEEKNHVISTANEALHKQLRRIDSIWPHLLEEFSDEAKWGSNTHWAYPENRVGRALTNAQAERSRREGAASLSAAAQHIAEEVAARSDARKQAVAAKKDKSRTVAQQQPQQPQQQQPQLQQQQQQPQQQQQQLQQQQLLLLPQLVSTATPSLESDAEDHDAKLHKAEPGTNKKAATGAKSRKPAANTSTAVSESPTPIGLGIANATPTNGTPAPKRRKVEKPSNPNNTTTTSNGVPMERAMSSVFGNSITKPKTSSPRGTPAPESQAKKRKALPTGGNQPKKRNGAANSPSMASSPVVGTFPDTVVKVVRNSPVPIPIPPTRAPAMARGKSSQSHGENGRPRPPIVAGNNRPNGAFSATAETPVHTNGSRASTETRTLKDAPVLGGLTTPLTRVEPPKPEPVVLESTTAIPPPIIPPPSIRSRKNSVAAKIEEVGETTVAKKETTPSSTHGGAGSTTSTSTATTVTTKSGRASKPSTPALGSFPDSARVSRPSRAADGVGVSTTAATPTTTSVPVAVKRSHKKGASVALAAAQAAAAAAQVQHGPAPNGAVFKKDAVGGGKDDDEDPLYCYCQQPSYGEMIGCDANEACPYEWFHLDCVGLKAAPKTNVKWYCKECKKRLGIPEKKSIATG
ncbi:hypothetical protein RB595_005123 [Gaeumannomyces hyphopodioides]